MERIKNIIFPSLHASSLTPVPRLPHRIPVRLYQLPTSKKYVLLDSKIIDLYCIHLFMHCWPSMKVYLNRSRFDLSQIILKAPPVTSYHNTRRFLSNRSVFSDKWIGPLELLRGIKYLFSLFLNISHNFKTLLYDWNDLVSMARRIVTILSTSNPIS